MKGLEYQIQFLCHTENNGRVGFQIGLSNRVKEILRKMIHASRHHSSSIPALDKLKWSEKFRSFWSIRFRNISIQVS